MKNFTLSAFADEYSPDVTLQIKALAENGIDLIEPRGVFGKNVSELTEKEAERLASMLDEAGIGISAIGSPAGKATFENTDEHLAVYENIIRISKILGAKRIRGFSFYCDPGKDRDAVMKTLYKMINSASKEGLLYCHENEKGIYGDTAERCLDIMQTFNGGVGCVFDPANFIQCGEDPAKAFDVLYPYVTYMHVKDALYDGTVTAAGEGEGHIGDMLCRLYKDGKQTVLTLEPHLKTFKGLTELENGERTKIRTAFSSNEEAFLYALEKLKTIIKNIKTEDSENG
ncbi:MAG: sugar phosphate isomerase/epimerase [Clostridia bacterium]|nr:sugar phosphate isomerase/epimerase [Clostridia bacterium]MBQ3870149.1 sugar phosphate isomerase/epimerase [Clostridia bacterium]